MARTLALRTNQYCHASLPASANYPKGCEKPVDKDLRVDLVDTVKLPLEHLTFALCMEVFKKHRNNERERKWALYAVAAQVSIPFGTPERRAPTQ